MRLEPPAMWRSIADRIELLDNAARQGGSCLLKVDGLRGTVNVYTLMVWDAGGEPLYRRDGPDMSAMVSDALAAIGPVAVRDHSQRGWTDGAADLACLDEWARTGYVVCLYIDSQRKHGGLYQVSLLSETPDLNAVAEASDDLGSVLQAALGAARSAFPDR